MHLRFVLLALAVALTTTACAGGQKSDTAVEDAVAAYERGDYATALRLMRPLAEQGSADAQHSLGVMYDEGQGVPQDFAEALKWYRKAANAQYNLGLMYYEDRGVPQDYVQAYLWLSLANSGLALFPRDVQSTLDAITPKMTPAQIAEAQRLVREWKPKSEQLHGHEPYPS